MDWPVIGAVSAAVVVAGAVTFEVVVFMQSDPAPVKRAPQLANYQTSVERSAYELPGFSTGRPSEWTPSFPLIPLIDPDSTPQDDDPKTVTGPAPATASKKKSPAASTLAKPAAPSAPSDPPRATPPGEAKTATSGPPVAQPRAEQWRVVVMPNASYFNLGGHVDSSGIVDSLASSHLRDALKSHRNFPQLPPDIRTHILTQNIDLNKLAPYRRLVGMNDRALEEEQAVRFERVASR